MITGWLSTKSCSPVSKSPTSKIRRQPREAALVTFQRPHRPLHAHAWQSTAAAPAAETTAEPQQSSDKIDFMGVHHIGILCKDLQTSLNFYQGTLGLDLNPERPHDKLPYDGRSMEGGTGMLALASLPSDPFSSVWRLLGCRILLASLGDAAIFFRDPDHNTWEFVELSPWR
ncbi:hypothetical protein WJX74_010538 [Apatococcus lobatus]|uniref:Glyoxalase/fosfomycin resistance/dioxygenase domain-containing protein n=1 Tax=Apatococcus lobatus TaxID=904363 RepID=A0AAW1QLZ6_9CHLO